MNLARNGALCSARRTLSARRERERGDSGSGRDSLYSVWYREVRAGALSTPFNI